ncbi:aminotransferase-like domain-containing protein [Aspergillus clavatus NRRL 1]|uniref:Aminotransferase, putative n=1 Tax=Aspergillus clavatus (strain ATCC 1007 / CBS 513.65 / DSM 816 / NCTC 3887 / NRRL 1 / QM 1276 / 107) TaxID=344612 RepID=A1CP17_ASPCL|nr:aminotransferase, putative [Aspergillus clavatus NRRL 1]EAW07388.1 aminotransferase, putative [Aspergillus clavatus NRRL 1]
MDSVIDLSRGWPNPALLPTTALANASATVLSTPSIWTPALLYGPDPGYEPLRQAVAQWLTSFYHPRHPITSNRICITGGASQNLACIFQVFTDPSYTRNVWMVAPTYQLASRMVDDAGFAGRMRVIPQDATGLDLAFLRRELEVAEEKANAEHRSEPKLKPPRPWGKIYKHVIYAIPTFSNPSTLTMSQSDRESLVQLARDFDALIVTDDVYDFLQWSADPNAPLSTPHKAPEPRLVDVDAYLDGGPKDEWGNVVSNGSFSKLIGPGMRTGWAEGTAKFAYGLSQTGSSRSGGAPSQMASTIVAQLLETGAFQTHLAQVLLPAYARRYHRLMSAVREHLVPVGAAPRESSRVAGGYFIWVRLPAPLRARDLARTALEKHQVNVAPGEIFQVPGDSEHGANDFCDHLRLCFAWVEEEQLAEGVCRLGRAIREALESSGKL